MKKEIIGILLFALVIFTFISLISYHPGDPSLHTAAPGQDIHNIFGVAGARVAGFFIGIFGMGAFVIPIGLLYSGVMMFLGKPREMIFTAACGFGLLTAAVGALFAVSSPTTRLMGVDYASGGILGISLAALFSAYLNAVGAYFLLFLMTLIGLILVTRASLVGLFAAITNFANRIKERFRNFLIKSIERRKKAQKKAGIKKRAAKNSPKPPVAIMKPADTDRIEIKPRPKQTKLAFKGIKSGKDFKLPSLNFLDDPDPRIQSADDENLKVKSRMLENKLNDFGVNGRVETVLPGPVVTTFEYAPAPGVKINRIVNLSDDLALALRALSIRIVAPIPGKAVIGIEIPNEKREIVRFKEIVASGPFEKSKSRLTVCVGKDIIGHPVVAQLDKMPHLLIAGATGTGKSVGLNAMITSILYKASPDEVKMIMIDPKRIELSLYDGIPHLISPVVTDMKKATNALYWAVREMEARYEKLAGLKVRNIEQYNKKVLKPVKKDPEEEPLEPLPYIVVIIDELADLMMVASRDVEVALMRLAQMARAAGIHLILATQRPSVDVLTGIIKANFPTRLSFQVTSKTDSRTILDTNGAEALLGMGDMLFLPPGTAKLKRIHGAYISEAELIRIIEFLKDQKPPEYDETVTEITAKPESKPEDDAYDERYDDAVALVTKTRQASISMVQRHLRIGYNRAARIIETMEREGVIGPAAGTKPREVLAPGYDNMP